MRRGLPLFLIGVLAAGAAIAVVVSRRSPGDRRPPVESPSPPPGPVEEPPERMPQPSAEEVAGARRLLEEADEQIRFGAWDDAEASLRRCLEVLPDAPDVHAAVARLHLGRRLEPFGRRRSVEEEDVLVDRALAATTQALARQPDHVPALRVRFRVYHDPTLRRYDPDIALADGGRILEREPHDVEFRRAFVRWLIGDTRFRRDTGDRRAFDSDIGYEIAELHLEELIDQTPVGTEVYIEARYRHGVALLYMGDFERAAGAFRALAPLAASRDQKASVLTHLGTALYRQGRFEEAARVFGESLNERATLETAWLLQLCADRLEPPTEPESNGAPGPFLRPPEPVDLARPPKLRFREMGRELGVAKLDGAGPSAFVDYDGDGDPDILAAGCNTFTALYRNDGKRFTDVTVEAGLFELPSGFSANVVDYDDDGHLDIYVGRNGWNGPAPNVLLRNRGDGTFEDVSEPSGLADAGSTFVSLWSDVDRDGDLDVFLCNGVTLDGSTNRLYRNEGDGTFIDGTAAAGLDETPRWGTIGAAIGDYDRDGDPDIFVNGRGAAPNRLYRNRGKGAFDEVASDARVSGSPHNGYVAFLVDVDNDAYPDIISTNLAPWEEVLQGMIGTEPPSGRHRLTSNVTRLYRNRRNGTFEDVTYEAGLVRPHGVMGANVADLDNDGWIDLYLGTGAPSLERLEPSAFYRNVGGGVFVELGRFTGLDHLGKGHGVSFADHDGDGDLDVYAAQGGFCHGDLWENPFYRNEAGSEHHWLHLRLVGVDSNRFAVGAQVTLHAGETKQYREVTGGVGFGSTDSYEVEFGLGETAAVDRVEILWPNGKRQTLERPPVDSLLEVVEGKGAWKVANR